MRMLISVPGLLFLLSTAPQSLLCQEVPEEAVSEKPVFTPFTEAPKLKDRREAERSVVRHYPVELRDAGVGGEVMVWVFVDRDGRVKNALVNKRSGHPPLDEGAIAAVREFRFIPARHHDQVVHVWITLPIRFIIR